MNEQSKEKLARVVEEVMEHHREYIKPKLNPENALQDWTLAMIVHDFAADAERYSYEAEHREKMIQIAATAIEAVLAFDVRWGGEK